MNEVCETGTPVYRPYPRIRKSNHWQMSLLLYHNTMKMSQYLIGLQYKSTKLLRFVAFRSHHIKGFGGRLICRTFHRRARKLYCS